MQLVFEFKNQPINLEFLKPLKDKLSYQPLRKIGDNEWYEGQWSNQNFSHKGSGLLVIFDIENLVERREIFIGEFTKPI